LAKIRTENKEGVSKQKVARFPHQEMQQSLQKEQHASQYRCFFRKPRSHSASDFASSASLNVRPVAEGRRTKHTRAASPTFCSVPTKTTKTMKTTKTTNEKNKKKEKNKNKKRVWRFLLRTV
jgi:hypothetical protein